MFLINPLTNDVIFDTVPALKRKDLNTEEGHIHLLLGQHTGPNRGYGAVHIWAEHQKELTQKGWTTLEEVPRFVAHVLQPKVNLHFEGGNYRKTRINTIRLGAGNCILEYYLTPNPHWRVVTAYVGRSGKGILVGTLK